MSLDPGHVLVRPDQIPQGRKAMNCDAEDPVQGGVGIDPHFPAFLGRDDALDGMKLQDSNQWVFSSGHFDPESSAAYPKKYVENLDDVVLLTISNLLVIIVQEGVKEIRVVRKNGQHDPGDQDRHHGDPGGHPLVVIRREMKPFSIVWHLVLNLLYNI